MVRPARRDTPETSGVITDLQVLADRVESMYRNGSPVYFDTENTGLNPRTLSPILLQFYQEGSPVLLFDARRCDRQLVGKVLAPLFQGHLLIVGANLKYDYQVLKQVFGVTLRRVFDVMLAEQVIYGLGLSDGRSQHISFSLKAITHRRLGLEVSKEERNWFIDLDTRPAEWNAPFPEEVLTYAERDVTLLEAIFSQQYAELQEKKLVEVAQIEMRCLPAIAEIERNGMQINVPGWKQFISEKEKEASDLEEKVLEMLAPAILEARARKYDEDLKVYNAWQEKWKQFDAGLEMGYSGNLWNADEDTPAETWEDYAYLTEHPKPTKPKVPDTKLSLGSRTNLLDAFHLLGIPVTSVAQEALVPFKAQFPVIDEYLKWKKAIKFVQSFGNSILEKLDPVDGRLHAEVNQIGASTDRMSSQNPNAQQFPHQGDGERLRELFVAPSGKKLLTADFSNIELRILADLSGDETMLRLFKEGKDLHSETARMMFNLDEHLSIPELKKLRMPNGIKYRDVAKTINFGLAYGQGPSGLASTLKLPVVEAKELMEKYFQLYPGAKKWLDAQANLAMDTLQSRCKHGWVRHYRLGSKPASPEALSEWKGKRAEIGRCGKNTPIQGLSAGITKVALALFFDYSCLEYSKGNPKLIAVVHDEIVVEVEEEHAEYWAQTLEESMYCACTTYLNRVHIPDVEVSIGDTWHKA